MKELYEKDRGLLDQKDRMKRMKEGREHLSIIKKQEGKGVVSLGVLDEINLDNIDDFISEMPYPSK
jgi:hypothetical protein